MSKFFSSKYSSLEPYVPGEQPRDQQYIKLNTNESPFPPAPSVLDAVKQEASKLQLYSDPNSTDLTAAVASYYSLNPSQVLMTNGSDEILNFAFMAFGDDDNPFCFPDISYGFYEVIASLNGIPFKKIPLNEDFTINIDAFCNVDCNIVIPNPNAPTGIPLSISDIQKIIESNSNHVVIIDEAYVDFGAPSCIDLISKYDNLLVTQTFSKSRSLAGGRIGMGFACNELIQDMNTLKYSGNPYNVNRMSSAAGIAAINDSAYFENNIEKIKKTRSITIEALRERGFTVLDSAANFVFAKAPNCSGDEFYNILKDNGILIRHWNSERIKDWCRITIGSDDQMQVMINKIDELIERGVL